MLSSDGPICERYASYEEARQRVQSFPREGLKGMPLIFRLLPDGSQRLVREDGKPLQWHRFPEDRDARNADPLPLLEDPELESGPVGPVPITWPERDDRPPEQGAQ